MSRILITLLICLSLVAIPACTTTTNPDGSQTQEIDTEALFQAVNAAIGIYMQLSALDHEDKPEEAEASQLETVIALLDTLEQRGLLDRFLAKFPERADTVKAVTAAS